MVLDNIRKKCGEVGISLYALEKVLGFGNGTISSWATSSPSVDKLKRVSDYFGVTVDELITERQNASPLEGASYEDH